MDKDMDLLSLVKELDKLRDMAERVGYELPQSELRDLLQQAYMMGLAKGQAESKVSIDILTYKKLLDAEKAMKKGMEGLRRGIEQSQKETECKGE